MKNQTAEEILAELLPDFDILLSNNARVKLGKSIHQFASQQSALAVAKRDDQLEPLIYAMNDYITLLGKELDDCAVMLSVHGWQSKRVQEGIDARNKILEIKESLSTPTVETSAEIAQVEPSIPIREIEELRDEIEEINLRLDLVSDSELIQCYGSIIGRLNMMLQSKKK